MPKKKGSRKSSTQKRKKKITKRITRKIPRTTKRKIARVAKVGIGAALERAAEEIRKNERRM